MATPPRFAIPGTYLITRRTVQRMLLLRPSEQVNAILLYCLALAANRFGIVIHAFVFLSTHGHLVVTDPDGHRLSSFLQYLFSLSARALNHHHGRRENLWSTRKPSCVLIVPRAQDLVDKICYVLCNAVLSGLVCRMNKWPGIKVTADQVGRLTITARRPPVFFRRGMPEEITFTTSLPQCEDATEDELAARIQARCAEIEKNRRAQMVREDKAFLGVRRALEADPFSSASNPESLFELEPHVASKDKVIRVAFLRRLTGFRMAYRVALEAFRSGDRSTVFPWGTLNMVRFFRCRCRGPDPNPTVGALAL